MIEENELFAAKPWHISEEVNARLDAALQRKPEEHRSYLGASLLGDPCIHRIHYTWDGVAPDSSPSGESLRILDIGHQLEPLIASWLQKAGFVLQTHDENGKQWGFTQADGKIQGHIDGVIIRGPLKWDYPLLWECKTMKSARWRELMKNKLEVVNDRYYAQVQLYMAYMPFKCCLFTSLNKDTAELYHELIPFDGKAASFYSDRAVQILKTQEAHEDVSRLASSPEYFECKMCRFYKTCWQNEKKM